MFGASALEIPMDDVGRSRRQGNREWEFFRFGVLPWDVQTCVSSLHPCALESHEVSGPETRIESNNHDVAKPVRTVGEESHLFVVREPPRAGGPFLIQHNSYKRRAGCPRPSNRAAKRRFEDTQFFRDRCEADLGASLGHIFFDLQRGQIPQKQCSPSCDELRQDETIALLRTHGLSARHHLDVVGNQFGYGVVSVGRGAPSQRVRATSVFHAQKNSSASGRSSTMVFTRTRCPFTWSDIHHVRLSGRR